MLNFQPDIVQQQLLVRVAELQLLIARNQLLPQLNLQALYQFNGLGQQLDSAEAVMTGATLKALNPVIAADQRLAGLNSQPGNVQQLHPVAGWLHVPDAAGNAVALANTRSAQYTLLRARAYLQQIVHQTTHSLARFFLEIDANYKQFKTASRLRAAAAQRLESQRAYYEEGRITIDRFLDAVSQYATAVATEAQYKTTYNVSIVALEEAKGTLLAYDNIAVAEGPHPSKAYVQARDIQDAHSRFRILPDGPQVPNRQVGPINPDPIDPAATSGCGCPRRPAAIARPRRSAGPQALANAAVYAGTIAADPVPEREWNRRGSGGTRGSNGRRGQHRGGRRPAHGRSSQGRMPNTRSASLIDPAVPGMGRSSVADSLGAGPGRARRRLAFTSAAPGGGAGPATARPGTAPAGGGAPADEELPPLPVSIDLPPLPKD